VRLLEQSVQQLFCLAAQFFLVHQQVEGKDNRQKTGDNAVEDSAGYREGGVEYITRTVLQEVDHLGDNLPPVDRGQIQIQVQLLQPYCRLWHPVHQLLQPLVEHQWEIAQIIDNGRKAADRFRYNNQCADADDTKDQQQAQNQAEWSLGAVPERNFVGCFGCSFACRLGSCLCGKALLVRLDKAGVFQSPHRNVDHKGNHATDQEGLKQSQRKSNQAFDKFCVF